VLAEKGDLGVIESSWTIPQILDLNDLLDAKEDGEELYRKALEAKRRAGKKR